MLEVSVVIANRNYGQYLEEAILSILNQTIRNNLELIIVDDCSTDNSREIINRYKHCLTPIFLKKQVGCWKARNIGFKKAKGKYYTYLDSDDSVSWIKLQVERDFLHNNPKIDVVFSGMNSLKYGYTPQKDFNLLKYLRENTISGCATMFRAGVYKEVGGFCEDYSYSMDYEFFCKLATKGYKFGKLDLPLYQHRFHKESISSKHKKEQKEIAEIIRKKYPIISVIIPIYDRTELLERAIESVFRQSYQGFELVLVLDGSPDQTLKIVDKYAKHPQVKIIRRAKQSGNACIPRNEGLLKAKGDFVAFLDSDDEMKENRLEISLEKIGDADLLYGGYELLGEKLKKVYPGFYGLKEYKSGLNPINTSTVMARRDSIIQLGGFKPKMKYCEDFELWMRMLYYGKKFVAVQDILSTYRLHKNNLEKKFKPEQKKWINLAVKEHQKVYHIKNKKRVKVKVPERDFDKILYIVPALSLSGGIKIALEHTNRLKKLGCETFIVATNGDMDCDWFKIKSRILSVEEARRMKFEVGVATWWQTLEFLDELDIKKKCYLVQSKEDMFYDPPNKAVLETYERKDLTYIAVAKWLKRFLENAYHQKVHYIPNGIDTKVFKKAEVRAHPFRVLVEGPACVGLKRVKEILETLKPIRDKVSVWTVSQHNKSAEWAEKNFIKVDSKQMARIYQNCDVLIKGSIIEGSPLPVMEMMACGGTVIMSDIPASTEHIRNNINGLLFKTDNFNDLRRKVLKLRESPALLQKLKRGAFKHSKINFRWDNKITELKKVLCEPV